MQRSFLALTALALILTGCGQPATQQPSPTPIATAVSAAPTAAPSAAPAPTSAPTEARPTAAPAGVLPAPILFITDANQIARLEVDGITVTTLTDEPELIFDIAVAPDSGSIAYITFGEANSSTLIRIDADGGGRTELASGIIRGLTIAADGSVQAGALFTTTRADGASLQAGAWSFPADGGEPTLLVAATDPTTSGGTVTPGVHYQPLAWSPDGRRLLLRLTMNMGPDGPGGDIGSIGLALYDADSGEVRDLLTLGSEPICVVPVWSRASDAVLCANGAAIGPPTPPLWRLNLASGAQEPIVAAGEPTDLILSPLDLPDGLYFLAGEGINSAQQYTPRRVRPDGTSESLLPQPVEAGFDGALWTPDGRAMIIGRPSAGANRTIILQPLGAGEPIELLSGSIGRLMWLPQP